MCRKFFQYTHVVFFLSLSCVLVLSIGCATTTTVEEVEIETEIESEIVEETALDQIYADSTAARNEAVAIRANEYDRVLFATAEAIYTEGADLYAENNERAFQPLAAALQMYNKLIDLVQALDLRALAEGEYEQAVIKFDATTNDIADLSDSLIKEGIVSAENGRFPQDEFIEEVQSSDLNLDDTEAEMMDKDGDAEMMDKDAEMMDKDVEMMDKDAEMMDKDAEMMDKDAEMMDKDAEMMDKDGEMMDKDMMDKDAEMMDKDAEMMDKDADAETTDKDTDTSGEGQ